MKAEYIKKVTILGAGTMGQQIGTASATHGYTTFVYDVSEEVLEKGKKRMFKLMKWMAEAGIVSPQAVDEGIERLVFTTSMEEAARDCDIVSESIPEDPALKGKVFSQFNVLCPERTIFTTNTSTLLPSMFAEETGRPDRLAALHFHDVRITKVVDVMPHPGTSSETMETVETFARNIGQLPLVMKKQSPGYVFNFMLSALFKSAQQLAANDVASVEDIDRAWMGVMHTPIGPFGIMDSVGLDTVYKITSYWAEKLNDPQGKKNAEFMKPYIEKGELGSKTGKGFYSYPSPAFTDVDFMKK